MGLDKSKVLRMSVKKYCDLKLVSPKDYNFVGVHAFSDKYSSGLQGSINLDYYFRIHNIPESVQQYQGEGSYSRLEFKTYTPLELIALYSPKGAEAVLEFEYELIKKREGDSGDEAIVGLSAHAVALVPKKQKK